jgi:hypothetical protein
MNDERRNDRERRRGRHALALGLIASALLHLLLVVLNPAMVAPYFGHAVGGTMAAPGAQFTVLSLSPRDDDELIQLEAIPPEVTPQTAPFGTPGAAPAETGGSGPAAGAETRAKATVAERLRSNARRYSAPVGLEREPANLRALRETRERVLDAAEELGPLPPTGVAARRGGGGGGGGMSIPFGFKPPPPAQTVPAPPLPASILRQDSIRAAARAAARADSIRAARDTTRLRNVAPRRPLIIPRVVPDTTVAERR